MIGEMKQHLAQSIIPFWRNLKDESYGGYYGFMDYDLRVEKEAVKGCILNSRILWFYSNAWLVLREDALLKDAKHAYDFLINHCLDREQGGIYWSLRFDGSVEDSTKHTYNQAFAIYALSSYFSATGKEEARDTALQLFHLIEEKCRDEEGYLEAFDRDFRPVSNEKLSENGVLAGKTMNTLLHVFEAYTELYRVTADVRVKERLKWILELVAEKVYNRELHRQEVFFDEHMNSILDLHSYGHDIEAAWLLDRGCEILNDDEITDRLRPVTQALTEQVYKAAFDGRSLANECCRGIVDQTRVWWVQAEAVVGFVNGYEKNPAEKKYLEAAAKEWDFIKEYVIDKRTGSEWFWQVEKDGRPDPAKPIVEPWKCPYHNGRMCMEVIRRGIDA